MSEDILVEKAKQIITDNADNKALKYIKSKLKSENQVLTKREIDFYIEFIKTGKIYKSYQKAFGEDISYQVAAVLGNRLLKKVKVDFLEFLEVSGHGPDKITEALDALFEKDKDAYLKHVTRLKQLDVQRIEHSGQIDIPTINIVSTKKE